MSSEKGNFQKFKDDPEAKKDGAKQKFINLRRKPKEIVYKDCKLDLNHLFYVNHKVQIFNRHSLLPNMTLGNCPIEDCTDLSRYNYPYYTMSEPCPVYIARKHCERVDPCFRRIIARKFYRSRLINASTSYQTALKNNRQLRKLEKENAYHPTIFTFAERIECNPDPYFYGSYDYYYTGGNLCVLSNEDKYIMHVDDIDPSTIRASMFPSEGDSSSLCLEEFATKRLPNESEIFQISSLINVNNRTRNVVGVRQRNNITIIKILPQTKDISIITEFKTKSTPFISFAQSADNPEIFVLTTMKENIRVYDISRKDVSIIDGSIAQKDKNRINWNTVQFLKNQSFLYANERQLCLMDVRTPKENWSKTCNFSSKEFPCEFISSLAKSQFEHLFYVGSSHKLRCLDMRCFGKKDFFENISVCEWTHQLECPPSLMDIYNSNKREYISIASLIAGDIRLCEITRALNADCLTESFYKSYCLPWQPPTLQEAYSSACLAGKTLQPEADFKQRIRCCTTGLAFYKSKMLKGSKTVMLWANSNGDIYAQTMQKRSLEGSDKRLSERSNTIMANYASKVSELTQPDLNYTDVVDFKAMRKVLLCKGLTGDFVKTDEETSHPHEKPDSKKRFKGGWQKSFTTLHSYKDALVQDLLSIWDIPKEDEIDIKYSELKKKFKSEKDNKDIFKWLNNDQTPVPTTSVPVTNLRTSFTEEGNTEFLTPANALLSDINETEITNINSSGFELDYSIQESSFVAKKPKLAKPKKKHVKGF